MSAQLHVIPMRATVAETVDVVQQVAAILEAANSLMREGHKIAAFSGDAQTIRPALWLWASPALSKLARVGAAQFDFQGVDENGPYRIGRFTRCGVEVKWLERSPS